jgi:hypothetical protein
LTHCKANAAIALKTAAQPLQPRLIFNSAEEKEGLLVYALQSQCVARAHKRPIKSTNLDERSEAEKEVPKIPDCDSIELLDRKTLVFVGREYSDYVLLSMFDLRLY